MSVHMQSLLAFMAGIAAAYPIPQGRTDLLCVSMGIAATCGFLAGNLAAKHRRKLQEARDGR